MGKWLSLFLIAGLIICGCAKQEPAPAPVPEPEPEAEAVEEPQADLMPEGSLNVEPVVKEPEPEPEPVITAPEPAAPETASFIPVADTTIHLYSGERKQSVGGRNYVRAKGGEDTGILKFDLSSLKGKKIESATLKVHMHANDLRYLGISTLTVPWNEGVSKEYAVEPGAAHYYSPVGEDGKYWGADNTSDFYSVCMGYGGSFWYQSDTTKHGKWRHAAVHPDIIYALANGDADSMVVYDNSGSARTNNSYFSREEQGKEPKLEVVFTDETDTTPPGKPGSISYSTREMSDGELIIRFGPASDTGFGRKAAFGYEVYWSESPISDIASANKVARYRIPHFPEHDGEYLVFLQGLPSGQTIHFAVRAYDAAGNLGGLTTGSYDLKALPMQSLADGSGLPMGRKADTPALAKSGMVEIYAVPGQVRIDPKTGDVQGNAEGDPRTGNSVWDGPTKSVRLFSAKEEIIDFVLSLKSDTPVNELKISCSGFGGPNGYQLPGGTHVKLYEVWCVQNKDAYIPEVCVPIKGSISIPTAGNNVPDQKAVGVWVDIYVPEDAPTGDYQGAVLVGTAKIPVSIKVVDVTLPGRPSHTNEVHTYSRTSNDGPMVAKMGGVKAVDTMVRQLSRWHRSTYNVLQYSHNGKLANEWSAPKFTGWGKEAKITDWSLFDNWYGPIFEGTIFTEEAGYVGPAQGEPEPLCYLPNNEFWPADLKTQYKFKTSIKSTGDRNKDRKELPNKIKKDHALNAPPLEVAFTQRYWDTWDTVNAQFVQHLKDKKWDDSRLQFYLNNKNNYHHTPNEGTWWILDEPSQMEDYYALSMFAREFREVVDKVGMDGTLIEYRGDVSRMRQLFGTGDGAYDCFVTSGDVFGAAYNLRLRRIRFEGELLCRYGGGITMTQPIYELNASMLKNWIFGCDGSMPYYQALGNKNYDAKSWGSNDHRLDIVYVPGPTGAMEPLASVRLKLQRRAVQDMEYYYKLAVVDGWNRELARRTLAAAFSFKSEIVQRNYEDPGEISFEGMHMDSMPLLRARAIATLLELDSSKQYPRPYGHVPTIPLLNGRWATKPASIIEAEKKAAEEAEAARILADKIANAATLTFKGRDAIQDGGLYSTQPDQSYKGGKFKIEARHDNDHIIGMLVNCDLSQLPAGKAVFDAKLTIYAWDCPSKMPNKLGLYLVTTPGVNPDFASFNKKNNTEGWQDGSFKPGVDTESDPAATAICPADAGSDVQDPPAPVTFDITEALNRANKEGAVCHGFYIAGIADRAVDDGYGVRAQFRTVDSGDGSNGPVIEINHEQ